MASWTSNRNRWMPPRRSWCVLRLAFRLIRANHLDHVKVSRLMFRLQRITGRSLPTPPAQPIRQPQDSCQMSRAQRQPSKKQTIWTTVESDIGFLCAW
jgi:hypothetical protein